MSLRWHLCLSVLFALLAGLACGTAMTYLQARQSVQHEMNRALGTASNIIGSVPLNTGSSNSGPLIRLVHGFDGDRHLKVQLWSGKTVLSSRPAPPEPAPEWFVGFLNVPPQQRDFYPGYSLKLTVTTNPHNEISETWEQLRDAVLVLVGSSLIMLVLVGLGFYWAAKPYNELVAAFKRLGSGDYMTSINARGPSELRELSGGFNAMAIKLNSFEIATRRLHGQLLSIEEEERSEIARDLHDNIGPLLFTAKLTAEKIKAEAMQNPALFQQAEGLTVLMEKTQEQMRQVLLRLRSEGDLPQDLALALENLVAFWKSHHPDLSIHLDISAAFVHMPEAMTDTAYHVVQEAITNAVRHSGATNLWLKFLQDGDAILVDIQDNGSGMAGAKPNLAPTYGLRGMRERVEAVGGHLSIRARQPNGTVISARFACETELQ